AFRERIVFLRGRILGGGRGADAGRTPPSCLSWRAAGPSPLNGMSEARGTRGRGGGARRARGAGKRCSDGVGSGRRIEGGVGTQEGGGIRARDTFGQTRGGRDADEVGGGQHGAEGDPAGLDAATVLHEGADYPCDARGGIVTTLVLTARRRAAALAARRAAGLPAAATALLTVVGDAAAAG